MFKKQIFKVRERFPGIPDLQRYARKRVPHFAMEYLECGTGREESLNANEKAFSNVRIEPRFMSGFVQPNLKAEIFNHEYDAPFGVAPIGMASLIWPGTEKQLAQMSHRNNIPFCMSTLVAESMNTIASDNPTTSWFQLYPTRDRTIRDKMIMQACALGFRALVLTIDVPTPSVRERQKRAGLSVPPRKNLGFWLSILSKPAWAMATLKRGEPRFLTLEEYVPKEKMRNQSQFFAEELGGTLDWKYFAEVRKLWTGPLIVKGILSPQDAERSLAEGADAIWVSNHGGRQFDASPSTIEQLPQIRQAIKGKCPILFDSGVRSGLDILRALHLGADFVFLGRPFVYGVAADPKAGAQEAHYILKRDLENVMIQCGCSTVDQVRNLDSYVAISTENAL